MIVTREGDSAWLVVRQVAHARASGEIAARWVRPAQVEAEIWRRFLAATSHHDNGWLAAEAQPAVDDAGSPVNFKAMPVDEHVRIWRRSIELAEGEDIFASLMIALHARALYINFGNEQTPAEKHAAQSFIDELSARADGYIDRLKQGSPAEAQAVRPDTLDMLRKLLTWFDGLSLAAAGGVPWPRQTEALCHGRRCDALALHIEHPRVVMTPWPFSESKVPIRMQAARLPMRRFESPAQLRAALDGAETVAMHCALTPR